jgi:hypothetical protein
VPDLVHIAELVTSAIAERAVVPVCQPLMRHLQGANNVNEGWDGLCSSPATC